MRRPAAHIQAKRQGTSRCASKTRGFEVTRLWSGHSRRQLGAMFHTKMHVKEFDLETYLFESHVEDLSFKDRQRIETVLKREIEELFHGRNLT